MSPVLTCREARVWWRLRSKQLPCGAGPMLFASSELRCPEAGVLLKPLLLRACMTCVCECACQSTHVEVRGQLRGVAATYYKAYHLTVYNLVFRKPMGSPLSPQSFPEESVISERVTHPVAGTLLCSPLHLPQCQLVQSLCILHLSCNRIIRPDFYVLL